MRPPASVRVPDFNPRPSYEERPFAEWPRKRRGRDFNPRPSYEERRAERSGAVLSTKDFNPRPSYEERLHAACHIMPEHVISIHAPHTRSDIAYEQLVQRCMYFNPRPSYEERRQKKANRKWLAISIHAPHTRSDIQARHIHHPPQISIHAPHTRSDNSGHVRPLFFWVNAKCCGMP